MRSAFQVFYGNESDRLAYVPLVDVKPSLVAFVAYTYSLTRPSLEIGGWTRTRAKQHHYMLQTGQALLKSFICADVNVIVAQCDILLLKVPCLPYFIIDALQA